MHQIIAFLFFTLMTIYILLNTILTWKITNKHPKFLKHPNSLIITKLSIAIISIVLLIIQILRKLSKTFKIK